MERRRIDADEVGERLSFARRRLDDLRTLQGGAIHNAQPAERQQPFQEFFFHLLGAIEVLAQFVDQERKLGVDRASIYRVRNALPKGELRDRVARLDADTTNRPLPEDPYSDDALLFRAYVYRHEVTHRRRLAFTFRVGSSPPMSLFLDPRDPERGVSSFPAVGELERMLGLVEGRCASVLACGGE